MNVVTARMIVETMLLTAEWASHVALSRITIHLVAPTETTVCRGNAGVLNENQIPDRHLFLASRADTTKPPNFCSTVSEQLLLLFAQQCKSIFVLGDDRLDFGRNRHSALLSVSYCPP